MRPSGSTSPATCGTTWASSAWAALPVFVTLVLALGTSCAHKVRPVVAPPPEAAEPTGKSRYITDLELLNFEGLADYDFAPHALADWVRRLGPRVDAQLDGDAADRTVQIQVTMHRDRDADIRIAASPPLAEPRRRAIAADLLRSRPPHTQLTDFSVRFIAKVNRGAADRDASCTPKLERPSVEFVQQLRAAPLKQRVALLSSWARRDVLPVLAQVMQGAPEPLDSVRSVGQLLAGLDTSRPIAVAEVLDHNPQYWRAMVEVQNGNPLIPAARIFLHVANGELDVARLYLKPVYYFSKSDNLAHDYIELFKELIVVFQADLDDRINRGVELHDRGQYEEAIRLYDNLLSEYPCSAMALYEKFFSTTLLRTRQRDPGSAATPPTSDSDTLAEWLRFRPRVYACNPMFTVDARTRGKRETFQAARRHDLRNLFKRERDHQSDWVKMADIGLDVEEFGFAAHLYLLIGRVLDPAQLNNRNLVEYWLYCLERLGVTTIKDQFKGDHPAEFERIAEERQQLMDSGPAPAAPVNQPGI